MALIRKIMTNKYVLTTLFVIPSAIFTSDDGYHKAIHHNINESDINNHISPTKTAIISGLKGIIFSPLVTPILGCFIIYHCIEYVDKNVSDIINQHNINIKIKDDE